MDGQNLSARFLGRTTGPLLPSLLSSQLDIVWEKVGEGLREKERRLKFNVVAVPRYRSLLRLLPLNWSVVIENGSER